MTDAYKNITENKVEKGARYNANFDALVEKAKKGEFTADWQGGDISQREFLVLNTKYVIRKQFSLEKGEDYYKLYKEQYFTPNYVTTDSNVIYRRIVAQKEQGDAKWAKAVADKISIEVIEG